MPKNVILITTDEQRWECIAGDAAAWCETPAIDRLRESGTTLHNVYANSPVCMPARFTWLTGLYASQTERGPRNGYDFPHNIRTMPQALQQRGFHTAMIGKLHAHNYFTLRETHLSDLETDSRAFGFDTVQESSGKALISLLNEGIKGCRYTDNLSERGLLERLVRDGITRNGFRERNSWSEPYEPGPLNADDSIDAFTAREAVDFIQEYDLDQPLFLHASLFGPHYPLDAPPEYFGRNRPADMPFPIGLEDPDIRDRWQKSRAAYCDMVALVDDCVGNILGAVRSNPLMEDSIVVFTTDHGDMLGDHLEEPKCVPYEPSVRTPMIVSFPGTVPGGHNLYGYAESVDLVATILEMAGIPYDEQAALLPRSPSESLLNYLTGGSMVRESAYSEMEDSSESDYRWRMLVCDNWKYVNWPSRGHALFDLSADPGETRNLFADHRHQERAISMQADLIDRISTHRVPPARHGS